MALFEQATEMAKDYLKQQLKNKIRKEVVNQVSNHFASFWYVYAIILAIFIFFYVIAAVISSTQTIAATAFLSEKFLPPQIYVPNLEKTMTDDFGERVHPVTGVQSFHSGIDLGIRVGTPVSSSTDGIVKTVYYPLTTDSEIKRSTGIFVAVQTNDADLEGIVTKYLHLSDAYVIPGQEVKKGQIIGLSGKTGRSTGPHLHYEMIPEGTEAIDPTPFITLMSQIVDVAADSAFDTMEDIDWSNVTGFDYETASQLYISNMYLESAAPTFSEQGIIYTRMLNGGGLVDSGSGAGGGSTSGPGPVITVPTRFGTLNNPFFLKWAEHAMVSENRTGIKASVTLAQMALESSWGRVDICNNVFGIKADRRWTGPSCSANTSEQSGGTAYPIKAKFRAYSSYLESFDDHANFLIVNPRYLTARSMNNPFEWANELQRAGYATDWQYANKLKSLMMKHNLTSLDRDRGINPKTGERWTDVPYNTGAFPGPLPVVAPVNKPPAAENNTEKVVIMFGIQQVYGDYGRQVIRSNGDITYSNMIDPYTGKPIINLENYNNMLHLYGGETEAPNIFIKDVPDAISITLESDSSEDLRVAQVQYIKGQY
ncbi:glucosaminidase domain-containing protein [Paenibacillus sp. PL91]|uniref:glucosaminidase domain-containing protein n=1 Tax=Paenibacillus sp. PL91 TaxID=2729538 RepID=UPI00145ED33C|nr:glucosaminidase domain-containing protein [Paenibacillus sp. PL91]MBC9204710.1 peptidoglycan DD-metalloendopeptidase family protein [Paenibacillus sp. PL91]